MHYVCASCIVGLNLYVWCIVSVLMCCMCMDVSMSTCCMCNICVSYAGVDSLCMCFVLCVCRGGVCACVLSVHVACVAYIVCTACDACLACVVCLCVRCVCGECVCVLCMCMCCLFRVTHAPKTSSSMTHERPNRALIQIMKIYQKCCHLRIYLQTHTIGYAEACAGFHQP